MNIVDWNCHEHREELRVSDCATVYHHEHGQLSQAEHHYDCIIFHPIRFKDKSAAIEWIQSGYIAEIQEGLSNLHVCFETRSFVSKVRT